MSLLIFPIAVVLGWFIRPPAHAAAMTVAVAVAALVPLFAMSVSGAPWGGVSLIEIAFFLIVGTPLAAWMSFKVSQWRLPHRSHSG